MQPARQDGPVTTIIFDLGRVIVDFDHALACRKAAEHSPFGPDEIFARIFTSGLEEQFDTGKISTEEFHRKACTLLEMPLPLEQFKSIWNTIFTLNDGTARIIERLAGFKLLLLSNTNRWHFDYCRERYRILNNFRDFILSFELGVRKPDKTIFQIALDRAESRPEECIYIDDVPQFAEAAGELGLHGIVFTSAGQLEAALERLNVL